MSELVVYIYSVEQWKETSLWLCVFPIPNYGLSNEYVYIHE